MLEHVRETSACLASFQLQRHVFVSIRRHTLSTHRCQCNMCMYVCMCVCVCTNIVFMHACTCGHACVPVYNIYTISRKQNNCSGLLSFSPTSQGESDRCVVGNLTRVIYRRSRGICWHTRKICSQDDSGFSPRIVYTAERFIAYLMVQIGIFVIRNGLQFQEGALLPCLESRYCIVTLTDMDM